MKAERSFCNNTTSLKIIVRTLYSRNFRLFFIGQGISLIGTWIQQIALSWLVYRLTKSAFMLGLVAFSSQIPALLLSPFGGILADRWSRHRILIYTQTLAMIQALILSLLILTGAISIWHIIVLSFFLSSVNAFDIPTRQSFVVNMIEKKEDLGNAIALNSSLFNGARLVGPAIAGVLIARLGEGICFLINGISYVAVIIALMAMKLNSATNENESQKAWQGLREGFSYVVSFQPIRLILLLLGLTSLMGMPYVVLGPIFAKEILHGDSHTLGFLMGAAGLGALIGAIYLASRRNVVGLEKLIAIFASIFGTALIIFSLSRVLWFSLVMIWMVGFALMIQTASSNTVIQTIVDDDKRGRVMSFYTMVFMGMAPFGSLLAGSLASKIGAPDTLLIGGIVCILGSIFFYNRLPLFEEMVRPIYVRKGLLLEAASGIQTTAELTVTMKE